MVAAPIHPISIDERGVAYIADTTMKVSHSAIDAETWHMTPLEIQDNYPHLSSGQIHAALSYYYDNRNAIDAEITESSENYERMRAEFPNPLSRQQFQERWERKDWSRKQWA